MRCLIFRPGHVMLPSISERWEPGQAIYSPTPNANLTLAELEDEIVLDLVVVCSLFVLRFSAFLRFRWLTCSPYALAASLRVSEPE